MEVQPQVLSLFGTKNLTQQFQVEGQPSFHFLNQVHCFVPCILFQGEISLERPYQTHLNCFEIALLGLLALSHRDINTLADMLCFPDPSFIRLLLTDFKHRGYIDAQHHLTTYGKEQAEKLKVRTPENKTAEATFFQNALTGTLLPYVAIAQSPLDSVDKKFITCQVHVGNTSSKEDDNHRETGENVMEECSRDTDAPVTSSRSNSRPTPVPRSPVSTTPVSKVLTFSVGTAGEKAVISGRALSRPTSVPPPPPPSSREAARLLREYHQYTKHASTSNGTSWKISTQYLGNALHLTPLYQTRYFHLQGGKVDGDADTLILSDGFLPSLVDMVHYMEEKESGWVQLVHENAIVARRLEEEAIICENQLYPQLKGSWLTPLSAPDGTKDREKALESTMRRGVIDMYGELEWALHYHFKEHPHSATLLQDYRGHLPSENRVLLARILDKTSLNQGDVDLISQFSGKINVSKGAPTMTSLMPLLLITWDKGESTLLSLLAQKLPDFYRTLSYLLPIRNKATHHGICTLSLQDFTHYQNFSSVFLDLVLPDWKKRLFVRKEVNENNSDTNRRLTAMKNLQQEFGFSYLKQHLTKEMVETLLQLAPENRHPSSPPEYIKGLCLLLELSFAQQLQVMDLSGEVVSQEEELWEEVATSNEEPVPLTTTRLVSILEERYQITLPTSLTTVNQTPLDLALSGTPSTLGAEVLAFLYLDHTGTGAYLIKKQALKVIHNIITLRGHGNLQDVSSLLLDKEDLHGLRHSVVSIMKGLVTYGKKE